MKHSIFLLFILFGISSSCQRTKIPESCLENLIDKPIEYILSDTTISNTGVKKDSTEFLFLFGVGSHLPSVFARNDTWGVPYMKVTTDDLIIQSIHFVFTNVGDVDPDLNVSSEILREHFCIDRTLKADSINRLWYDNYDVGEVNVDIKVLWDARKMDVMKIHYTKKE